MHLDCNHANWRIIDQWPRHFAQPVATLSWWSSQSFAPVHYRLAWYYPFCPQLKLSLRLIWIFWLKAWLIEHLARYNSLLSLALFYGKFWKACTSANWSPLVFYKGVVSMLPRKHKMSGFAIYCILSDTPMLLQFKMMLMLRDRLKAFHVSSWIIVQCWVYIHLQEVSHLSHLELKRHFSYCHNYWIRI